MNNSTVRPKWKTWRRALIGAVAVIFLTCWGIPQIEETPEYPLDILTIQELQEQVTEDPTLEEDLRTRLLALYSEALNVLTEAQRHKALAAEYHEEVPSINQRLESLQAELSGPLEKLTVPENISVERLNGMLKEELARLSELRDSLSDLEKNAAENTQRRKEISRHMSVLRQQAEQLSDNIRSMSEIGVNAQLFQATKISQLAQQEMVQNEIEEMLARQALMEVQAQLVPLLRDIARRNIAHREQFGTLLKEKSQIFWKQQRSTALKEALDLCADIRERFPAWIEVADETEELAQHLWGEEGIIAKLEQISLELAFTKKHQMNLNQMSQLLWSRIQIFGNQGNIWDWFPDIPEDFPRLPEQEKLVQQSKRYSLQIQVELIRLEKRRDEIGALSYKPPDTQAESTTEDTGRPTEEEEQAVSDLLNTRQEVLDVLIVRFGRASNQMIELDKAYNDLFKQTLAVGRFIREREYRVRSVPGSLLPSPKNISKAFLWIFSPQNWGTVFSSIATTFRTIPGRAILWLFLVILVIALRPRVMAQLDALSQKKSDPATDSFNLTLKALLYTALLSSPLPLTLYVFSTLIAHSSTSVFSNSVASGLHQLSMAAALLEFFRQLCRPQGLAQVHFERPVEVTERVYRGLFLPEIIFLLLFFVAQTLNAAGGGFESAKYLRTHHFSLGRIAFILSLTILALFLLRLFCPRGGRKSVASRGAAVAYPLIIGSLLLPAVMALFGYYLTGSMFIDLVLRSLRYLLIVAVASGLLSRWYQVSKMKLEARSEETTPGTGVDGEKGQTKVERRNIQLSEMRVKKLFNFTIILAIGIGLFTIWSEVMPTLHFMKRVEIWPQFRVRSQDYISPPIALPMQLTSVSKSEKSPQGETSVSAEELSKTVTPSAESGLPGETSSSLSGAADEKRAITLWDLIRALLSIIVIVIFTKNIPDVLDVVLIKHSHIDSGGRFAVSTLLRYGIIFVGLLTVANILGLKWSQVQWMAAGLTFGIGFGLQDTIANFISGLILLVERPIRVGDAVTVGNLGGRVTKIRIRSTTITLWNRSEMVVPNKEFITTKLINWTLSDSKRRIDIPLRVTYSSNIKKAKETLVSVAQQHSNVLEDPAPYAVVLEFGKDAIHLELRFYVDFGQGIQTKEDLNMSIAEAFHKAGIEFAVQSLNFQVLKDRMNDDQAESS